MYSKQITRTNPALVVVLVDRSESMAENVPHGMGVATKAQVVADSVNALLSEMVFRSQRYGGVVDYFSVAVVGYGDSTVEHLLPKGVMSISEVEQMTTTVSNRFVRYTLPTGQIVRGVVPAREWIKPVAAGNTPMGEAFSKTLRSLRGWCSSHRDSFPPIVINITDGEATDITYQQLAELAESIKQTGTDDGKTLLMNLHITSAGTVHQQRVKYPSESMPRPTGRLSRLLYDMSSTFPHIYNELLEDICGQGAKPPFRALCYNSSAEDVLQVVHIGSVSLNRVI